MPGCAAIGCNNRSEKGYSMKCFPRDPALRSLWTKRVCRADWVPSNNSFLCHVHFDVDQWILTQSGRVKLKRNAVPSIFTVTSTRKSPRKRRKLEDAEARGSIDFVEYLSDSLSCSTLMTARDALYDQFATKIGLNSAPESVMRGQSAQHQEIVVLDDGGQVPGKNGVVLNKDAAQPIECSEPIVKIETKSQMASDQELDDIERKLRWICDGELHPDDKTKAETPPTNKNGKIASADSVVTEKSSFPKVNGDANGRDAETSEAINKKRKSRCGIAKDTVGAGNSVNGINPKEEKDEKPCVDRVAPRESRFTIKVTGIDEDVTEIVRSLGSEPIYQYRSTSESSRSRNGYVTSVISVVDHPLSIVDDELLKPKTELDESAYADTKTNWNWPELKKHPADSQDDEENSTNYMQLRKKVKFQMEVIRTLTKQLADRKDLETAANELRAEADKKLANAKLSTLDHQCRKDDVVRDMSERLLRLDESNKNLNKQLTERDRQTKKLESQIRQRDSRIKELNWKLDKASKYLERAEKNTNNYRKKMINMQNLLARRKIREEKSQAADLPVASAAEVESVGNLAEERSRDEGSAEIEEHAVYRTVQDIFDESNDCDDDLSAIDTKEDFLREFRGAL